MFRAHIDTPFQMNGPEATYQLVHDPAYAALILHYFPVGSSEEVSPGVVLSGAGYPKATQIQPDHAKGRLAGSGDPDWCMLEVITETLATLDNIDNDPSDSYMLLWTEEIIEAP